MSFGRLERSVLRTVILVGASLAGAPVAGARDAQQAAPSGPELDAAAGTDDDARIWGRIVQHRSHSKESRHMIGVSAGLIPNDPLNWLVPLTLRYGYFFTESLGVVARGSWIARAPAALRQDLGDALWEHFESERRLQWNAGLGVEWLPIHGKTALGGTSLAHFDAGLTSSVGFMRSTWRNRNLSRADNSFFATVGLTGLAWVADRVALRLDVTGYAMRSGGENLTFPVEVSLGVTAFLGSSAGPAEGGPDEARLLACGVMAPERTERTPSGPGGEPGRGSVRVAATTEFVGGNVFLGERVHVSLGVAGRPVEWAFGLGGALRHRDSSYGMTVLGTLVVRAWDKPAVFPSLTASWTNFSERWGSGAWDPGWVVAAEPGLEWRFLRFEGGALSAVLAVPLGVSVRDISAIVGARKVASTDVGFSYGGALGLAVSAR
jgi:outer membrane beta-barrel protein